ncbi:hypothetical protein BCR42DRAFT_490299 [Absidia repens]|uniref:Pentacotripeptide-repeat region of PRORP domain-containing protein n=1 Tax=Absidia repens TaxID=90262 RepID=A0A1X2IMM0_9FUNG|nr:hypothetical protein BCR42DRAFT_490299 [Absidia repens]
MYVQGGGVQPVFSGELDGELPKKKGKRMNSLVVCLSETESINSLIIVLGHTSQKPFTLYFQQSAKHKSITQRPLWAIPRQQQQQQQQQLRSLSGTQCLQYERSRRKDTDDDISQKKKKFTYKKRLYVNLEGAEERRNRHLYTLPKNTFGTSDRVTQLLKFEGVDTAYEFLTNVPLDLQSTVTWNQLLNQCGTEGRASLAESIFVQMRKRGIEPSERTFAHILTAFVNSNSPKAVERAESWVEKMDTYAIQPTAFHYNTLLNVYGKAEQYNHVVAKVRQMMRDDGLLPYPDHVTLSIALQTAPLLVNNPNKEIKRIWKYISDCLKDDYGYKENRSYQQRASHSPQVSSLQAKVNALQSSDSTFRHDQLLIKEQKKSLDAAKYSREPLEVDDTLVVALIRAIGRSNMKKSGGDGKLDIDDHLKMTMDMMDQLYGIRPSTPKMPLPDTDKSDEFKCFGLAPGVKVLDAIVRYCGAFREFELGEAYFDLALRKFPQLEPDARAYDAYAWMQSNTRRKTFKKSNKNGSGNE